jgi:O-acetyl-ADP-ribose deacetylase (regulator of RNase III)
MIKYVRGDLFDSKADILAHGVNCRGAFGSGVARTMAMKYPKARHYYLEKYDEEEWKLGEVQFVNVVGGKIIANCATQDDFLPRGVCHADYEAIRSCMLQVKAFASSSNRTIAIPKIGAGLAGGSWEAIEKILKEVFDNYDITVYHLGN